MSTIVKQQLILIRGIPGSGKTTLAREMIQDLHNSTHIEADHWRNSGKDGRVYDDAWNEVAHGWAFGKAADALLHGCKYVIVCNVFARLDRMALYAQLRDNLNAMGHDVTLTIIHVQGPVGRSVHEGVNYQHYIDQWQDYKGEFH